MCKLYMRVRDGEIVGQGAHEELMEGCGEYRRRVLSAAELLLYECY
ncbi:MAG: hypothetical protein K2O97_09355 [Acetatifactor sp.]|nr:hypothetical protein [Acetatifactor sp.]